MLCSGSLSQHPLLRAVGISILQVPTGDSRRGATLPIPPAAPSAHNPRSTLSISSPIFRVLGILSAAWCGAGSDPPPLQKIIFYSKFSLLKATEEEKSPSWSQGQIWCLCSVKPHFFCHKLISSSADSQGHFNFTSEISPEEAKLFYSLENIK